MYPAAPGWRAALAIMLMTLLTGCTAQRITADPVYFPPPPDAPHAVHLVSFNALREIVTPQTSWVDAFRGGPANPFVHRPAGIAFAGTRLYICDTGADCVHIWDLADGTARRLGDSGSITLGEPVAVAVDETGSVYVADTKRGEVIVFDGPDVRSLAPRDRAGFRPVALAVRHGTLFVADVSRHRIHRFAAPDGAYLGAFGETGSEPGRFYYPMGLAFDEDGSLYVSDTMNARVQGFDRASRLRTIIGQPGNHYGDLGKPRHLALGPDGVLFIADAEFAYVHLFDRDGVLLMLLGGPHEPVAATPLPAGVAVAPALPENLTALVPADFRAAYFLFVANGVGDKRLSLYAIGEGQAPPADGRPEARATPGGVREKIGGCDSHACVAMFGVASQA